MTTLIAALLLAGVATADGWSANGGGSLAQAGQMGSQAGNMAPGAGRFGQGPGLGGPPMEKMRRHVEQLRILKLLELLDLDEDKEIAVLAAFSRSQREAQVLRDSLDQLVDQLASGLKDSSLTDREITALVDEIDNIERATLTRMMQFNEEMKPLLTAEQQGKIVVFRYRFEEELLRQVRAFRDKDGPGPPMFEDSLENDPDNR